MGVDGDRGEVGGGASTGADVWRPHIHQVVMERSHQLTRRLPETIHWEQKIKQKIILNIF